MNRRILIGIALIMLAAVAIAAYQFVPKPDTRPVSTVKGFIGSEKAGLLDDPDIQRILADKYKLKVDYRTAGSIEQVQGDTTGQDFLWPSSEVALALYKELHGGQANSVTVFNSPLVLYSWDSVVGKLADKGYVATEGNGYYVVDLENFTKAILPSSGNPVKWKDLGLTQFGPVNITPTDPTKSNSGFMFFGLLANMLAGGQVADDTTIGNVLPDLKKYYNSLGYLETGSGDLFKNFIRTGEGSKPLIAGYENQLIEFLIANPQNRDEILKKIRIIYPRPTVWSAHPLIALTAKGQELQKAMQDPDIQKLAWEKHGFRTGLIGIQNDPKVLNIGGIPESISSVMPLPSPKVMDAIIKYLSQ